MDIVIPYDIISGIGNNDVYYTTTIKSLFPAWNSLFTPYSKSSESSPVLVKHNNKLYKSLTNLNYSEPGTNTLAWKYIQDIEYMSEQEWVYNNITVGQIYRFGNFYWLAISTAANTYPPNFSSPYWELVGYTNSTSLIQNKATGATRIYSSGEAIRLGSNSEIPTVALLNLENIEKVTITEKNTTYTGNTAGSSITNSTNLTWTGLSYSKALDILVLTGYNSSTSVPVIRYSQNVNQSTADYWELLNDPTKYTQIEPANTKVFDSVDYSPTIPNKIFWSELFQSFYIIGSTITGLINILKSSNGITWTPCQLSAVNLSGSTSAIKTIPTTSLGGGMLDITEGDGRLFALSKNAVWTSVDGNNWSETYVNSSWSFNQLCYVNASSTQSGYLCVVGKKVSTSIEGFAWIIHKQDNFLSHSREYTFTISQDFSMSTFYNVDSDQVLIGGMISALRVINTASLQPKANFTNDTVILATVNINTTFNNEVVTTISSSLEYGVLFATRTTNNQGTLHVYASLTPFVAATITKTLIELDKTDTSSGQTVYNPFNPKQFALNVVTGSFLLLSNYNWFNWDDNIISQTKSSIITGQNSLIINNNTTSTSGTLIYVYLQKSPLKDYGEISNLLLGPAPENIGITQSNISLAITDYSKKDVDEFGNIVFVERPYSERISTTIIIPSNKITDIYNKLISIRTTPCLWVGVQDSETYNFLTVLGFYKEFSVEINYPKYAIYSLSIESLTNF